MEESERGRSNEPKAPTSTSASTQHASFKNAYLLRKTPQLEALLTQLRDESTARATFIFVADRIIRLLVEEGLNHLPIISKSVTTPTGATYQGAGFQGKICGVSIMRAGEAMEQGLRDCCRSVRIGKLLIQRDEETAQPKLFFVKLPADIKERWVLLLDPMLATGGSAMRAIDVLLSKGVPQERLIFINLIAAPEGLKALCKTYPNVRVISAWLDECLDERRYIMPGLGDFGDRYFCDSARHIGASSLSYAGAITLDISSEDDADWRIGLLVSPDFASCCQDGEGCKP